MFVASLCACRSHWLQWDTCLFKSRNMAVSYGQHFFFSTTVHVFLPHTAVLFATHRVFWRITLCLLHQSHYTYTFIFSSACSIAHTCEKVCLCCWQKQHRSHTDFQSTVINCFINQDTPAVLAWWSRCMLYLNHIWQKGESSSSKEKQIQDVDGWKRPQSWK